MSEGYEFNSSAELINKLQQRYGAEGQVSIYRNELRSLRRRSGESLQYIYLEVSRLMPLAYQGTRSEHTESIAIDYFIDAIANGDIEIRIRDRSPKTLDDAYRTVVVLESNTNSRRSAPKDDYTHNRFEGRTRGVAVIFVA